MSTLYRQYIRLLERWPVDETKTGRDFGEYLREQVKNQFRRGELITENDRIRCERNYASLNRLSNDFYANQYPHSKEFTSCGLEAEYCRAILHNDNLAEMPMVLVRQVLDFLQPEKCSVLIDMTFGSGGHARKLLEKSEGLKIICLDRDPVAYRYACELQTEYPERVLPLRGRFSDMPGLLEAHGYGQNSVDGVLFDLGCSAMQFDAAERGFALGKDGPLDMRMDGGAYDGFTAADVLAHATEEDLNRIFRVYGQEKQSRKIARLVAQTRFSFRPITTTSELRDLVASAVNEETRLDSVGRLSHPSTKVFQALRMFVNNELNELNYALLLARSWLKIGGVLVAVSMHQLEDTVVKSHFTGNSDNVRGELPLSFYDYNAVFDPTSLGRIQQCCWKPINKHVITPGPSEVGSNPRSRSAKLRAAVKVL